jgi:hypothetical protein
MPRRGVLEIHIHAVQNLLSFSRTQNFTTIVTISRPSFLLWPISALSTQTQLIYLIYKLGEKYSQAQQLFYNYKYIT